MMKLGNVNQNVNQFQVLGKNPHCGTNRNYVLFM
jgi:hypothetical protein